jgi:hypothetical protein
LILDERKVKLFRKRFKLQAYGWLRQVQMSGCLGDTTMIGNGAKNLQLA